MDISEQFAEAVRTFNEAIRKPSPPWEYRVMVNREDYAAIKAAFDNGELPSDIKGIDEDLTDQLGKGEALLYRAPHVCPIEQAFPSAKSINVPRWEG